MIYKFVRNEGIELFGFFNRKRKMTITEEHKNYQKEKIEERIEERIEEKPKKELIINDGVLTKVIPSGKFLDDDIIIPSTVRRIEQGAFYDGVNHMTVLIPESVEYIDEKAFGYVKYVDIYGKSGSCAHEYVKNKKPGLTTFRFFSNYFPNLPEPEKNEEKTLKYDMTLKNVLLWDANLCSSDAVVSLPYKLFDLDKREKSESDGSVYSTRRCVIMQNDAELVVETTSISYSAHNMANCSSPTVYRDAISFDKLEMYINSSNDERAQEYIGMNENNWKTFLIKNVCCRTASKYPIVQFGQYYKYRSSDKMYPINWYVLENEKDMMLLVARDGLDICPWQEDADKNYVPDWNSCTLNKWLNSTFANVAFDCLEKNAIKNSKVSNNKIYCLSKEETENYLSNDSSAFLKPTDYALGKNVNVQLLEKAGNQSEEACAGNCLWWLRDDEGERSPTLYGYKQVSLVGADGKTEKNGRVYSLSPDKYNLCVRPAMWISKDILF